MGYGGDEIARRSVGATVRPARCSVERAPTPERQTARRCSPPGHDAAETRVGIIDAWPRGSSRAISSGGAEELARMEAAFDGTSGTHPSVADASSSGARPVSARVVSSARSRPRPKSGCYVPHRRLPADRQRCRAYAPFVEALRGLTRSVDPALLTGTLGPSAARSASVPGVRPLAAERPAGRRPRQTAGLAGGPTLRSDLHRPGAPLAPRPAGPRHRGHPVGRRGTRDS